MELVSKTNTILNLSGKVSAGTCFVYASDLKDQSCLSTYMARIYFLRTLDLDQITLILE